MNQDQRQKLFDYIALLESTNDQLLATLRRCLALSAEFTHSVPDSEGWQEMLDVFQETVKAGERAAGKKNLH